MLEMYFVINFCWCAFFNAYFCVCLVWVYLLMFVKTFWWILWSWVFWVDIFGEKCWSYIFDGYFLLDMFAVIIFLIDFFVLKGGPGANRRR